MVKIDMLPSCDEPDGDDFHDCGQPAVAYVEDPAHGLNMAYMCKRHLKEYLWDECRREATKNLASNNKGRHIKLRVRDVS